MTNKTKKLLSLSVLGGAVFYVFTAVLEVTALFSDAIADIDAAVLGMPLWLNAVLSSTFMLAMAWLCLAVYRILDNYYGGAGSFRPWLSQLRCSVWVLAAVHVAGKVIQLVDFAGHPFAGTLWHCFYTVIGSLHYLPLLIGVIFLVDVMTETLELRDEVAHTL